MRDLRCIRVNISSKEKRLSMEKKKKKGKSAPRKGKKEDRKEEREPTKKRVWEKKRTHQYHLDATHHLKRRACSKDSFTPDIHFYNSPDDVRSEIDDLS